jgi:glycosyltransferase involved in cell wall biosynthesis
MQTHQEPMKNKIKIMHVSGYMGIGGIEEVLLLTAKYNLKHKYDLSFVACRLKDTFISRQIENLGYPFWELGIAGRIYEPRLLTRLYTKFRQFAPQIVSIYGKISLLAVMAARMADVPIVICNEMDMNWQDCGIGLKVAAIVKRKFNRFADKYVACSEAVRRYWDRHNKGLYTVIYLPIDLADFPLPCGSSDGKSFKNGKYPVIGTVSRINPVKGHRYLIEAMPKILAKFPDLRLKIVGAGPLLEDMKALALSLGLGHAVEFTGFVDDVHQERCAMDIFLLPSISEGFPLSIMEAMAAGLPVAASEAGGIPEIVRHGETGLLFPARDPDAIAGAVTEMLSDFEASVEMGIRGRQRLIRLCSPEAYIENLDTLYRELLTAKGAC